MSPRFSELNTALGLLTLGFTTALCLTAESGWRVDCSLNRQTVNRCDHPCPLPPISDFCPLSSAFRLRCWTFGVECSTFASYYMPRCPWATTEPNITYHDQEWGVPVHDDRKLFEFLILEGAQAGLSWTTILKKRENYRKAFDGFRAEKIAALRRARCETTARRHRDRAQPIEDCSDDPECESFSRSPERVRQFRRVSMEFRRRQTETKSLAADVSGAGAHNRIRCHEP